MLVMSGCILFSGCGAGLTNDEACERDLNICVHTSSASSSDTSNSSESSSTSDYSENSTSSSDEPPISSSAPDYSSNASSSSSVNPFGNIDYSLQYGLEGADYWLSGRYLESDETYLTAQRIMSYRAALEAIEGYHVGEQLYDASVWRFEFKDGVDDPMAISPTMPKLTAQIFSSTPPETCHRIVNTANYNGDFNGEYGHGTDSDITLPENTLDGSVIVGFSTPKGNRISFRYDLYEGLVEYTINGITEGMDSGVFTDPQNRIEYGGGIVYKNSPITFCEI